MIKIKARAYILDHGKLTKLMASVYSSGLLAKVILETGVQKKNMVVES